MTSPHLNAGDRLDKNFNIRFTLFRDRFARFKQQKDASLAELAGAISRNKAEAKDQLPLVKLALFGDLATPKGSLRWDNNVQAITGVELDYDGGKISWDEARVMLLEANIAAILYTTPSHTEENPRWRVLAPFSVAMLPDDRYRMLARLNGAMGGAAHSESFSLSQAYYYGYVTEPPRVDVIDGDPVNLRADLDKGAIGRGKQQTGTGANGHAAGPHEFTDMEEMIRRIVAGESLHPSVLSIAGKIAARGDSKETCIEVVGGAFEAAKADRYTDKRWKDDVLRAIEYVWAKEEAKHKPPQPDEPPDPNWETRLHRSKKNTPIANLHNVILALQHAPELRGLLAYDEMLCSPMITRSPPAELTTNDITDIQLKLQILGLRTAGYETTKQAAVRHARNNSYHPIRNEFAQLAKEWDKQERVEKWLTTYAGCEDTEYHRGIGTFFLRQIVKRIFEPGCKADYMLILEGPQGMEKSKIIRILAGGEKYFSDNLPELDDRKECSQHLRGLLLIEIAEMDTFSRADINTLKAFLSRTHERYRPPYEPVEITEPRQCSFVGTANKETYLRDETGNRRYWGAKCGSINIPRLEADRNQIIGEAVTQYLEGKPTYPSREWELTNAAPEQDARFEEDPWTDPVQSFLARETKVSIPRVLTSMFALNIPKAQVDPGKARRVAAILRKLGWTTRRNKDRKWWVREGLDDQEPPREEEEKQYHPDDH